jgi:hypothetical protein
MQMLAVRTGLAAPSSAVKPGEESSTVSLAPRSDVELFPTG